MYILYNILTLISLVVCEITNEEKLIAIRDANKRKLQDNLIILLLIGLLILTVLTIWLFKLKRFRFFHETGVCMIYGIIVGMIIKYTGGSTKVQGFPVTINFTKPPNLLWVKGNNDSYSYSLLGILKTKVINKEGEFETKAVFDPEIFFYALLPPIIFYAGYDMKKRFFFRNLGAILTYAFFGTIISCFVFGGLMYGFVRMFSVYKDFSFQDCLLFGSVISATDPVTVLAIFHDLHVDVDLYALAFGESILNDAVSIVLYKSVESYSSQAFVFTSFLKSIGEFVAVFGGSLLIGSIMGLGNALLTKLTHLYQFPQLETALFTLMSYSTFLIAEAAELTGIVAVLFCGISQAHYTFNNLSDQSKSATKEVFGLLNFLAENFIFCYMGLTLFTFERHQWDIGFIGWAFLATAVSRFCNVYPLSFLMNLKRSKKIPMNFQHMLFFAGLRGAMAFALAIRNTESAARQLILTSTLIIAIATVVFNGSLTTYALMKLGIKVNVDPDDEISKETRLNSRGEEVEDISYERSWLVRKWHYFDIKYMKPLFTNNGGSLVLPGICSSICPCFSKPPHTQLVNEVYEKRDNQRLDGSSDEEMIDVSSDVMTKSMITNSENESQNSTIISHTSDIPML
ncbi:sodium/hydrogen exchanger 6 isoform X1 [Hydra vulgaris]|nr:sodium/hydrogen exchanger 9 isoform X1 [Hydra vulgaris]